MCISQKSQYIFQFTFFEESNGLLTKGSVMYDDKLCVKEFFDELL